MPEAVGTLTLPRLPSAPGTPNPGQMYYNTATGYTYYWNGTTWVQIPGASGGEEVWLGTAEPSPRADYEIWIDTDEPDPGTPIYVGSGAGGVLSGTYPAPSGLAAGAAATNVGALGGALSGTLPNPTLSVAADTGYGTSLPGSPVDGQKHILVDSLTAPTYQWQFRWGAGSSSAYKWQFIGGPPMLAGPTGSIVVTTTTPTDVTGGPTFTVPRAGNYRIIFGGDTVNNGLFGGAYATFMQIHIAGAGAGPYVGCRHHGVIWDGAATSGAFEANVAAASSVMNIRGWIDRTGSNSGISQCWFHITPVRVA